MPDVKAINPANAPTLAELVPTPTRKRRSLSMPSTRLEVPEIAGFHLYWFLEKNVPMALEAGYELVESTAAQLNQLNPGNASSLNGNADLGNGVKVMSGIGEGGRPEYLILMKIREEWWKEDQRAIELRNAQIMEAIFQKEQILGSENVAAGDRGNRYVKQALFQRPTRK